MSPEVPARTMLVALLIAWAILVASHAPAQQVHGIVSDGPAGTPLPGALVALFDADSVVRATTVSDDGGLFVFRAPTGDSLQLRVQRIGYAALASVPIVLAPGDSLRLEIRMRPEPLALEGVTVTGVARLRRPLERFLRRREMGFGTTLGPDELTGLPRTSAAILLSSVPGAFLFPGAAGTILARSRGGDLCQPDIYVDGLEVESPGSMTAEQGYGVPVSSYVHADLIMGVEVFRNPASAPFEFQEAFMSDCPVVLIWTNYSFGIGR